MHRDPVCGMAVDPNRPAGKSQHQGSTYYFCSPGCKRKFDQNPSEYLAKIGENRSTEAKLRLHHQ